MNRATFVKQMSLTGAVFGQEVTELMNEAYWEIFAGWSDEKFTNVMQYLRSSSDLKRFPTAPEITNAAKGRTDTQRADLAWKVVASVAWDCDGYLDFEDKLINATVRAIGGKARLGRDNMTNAEFDTWIRKEFIEKYLEFMVHLPTNDQTRKLGSVDGGNEKILERLGMPSRSELIRCDYIPQTEKRIEYKENYSDEARLLENQFKLN